MPPVDVALSVFGLAVLLTLCVLSVSKAAAPEIVILKSSEIAAYDDAVKGFKATAPSGAIFTEYDLARRLKLGKELARKIRASEPSLVVAVGLKAALAAKSEIVDIPIVYMMILDPLKHQLNGANMTGTLLEIPVDRQLKLLHTFLPTTVSSASCMIPARPPPRSRTQSRRPTAMSFNCRDSPSTAKRRCLNN